MDAPKPNIPEKIIPTNIEKPIEVAPNSPEVPSVDAKPSNIAGVKADDTGPTIGPDIEALTNIDDALNIQPITKPDAFGEIVAIKKTENAALDKYLNKNENKN